MNDETRYEERLRERLAREGYRDWRPPAGFGSTVLLRARSRAARRTRKGFALMRRRSVRFAAAAVGVCTLGLVTVGATTGFASVVEAGKRWFNLGGEGASVYVNAEEPTEVRGEAVLVTVNGNTGERTVERMELTPEMLDAYAPLEEIEAGVAEGKYQVEKTRGTLADMDALCPPMNLELPEDLELPDDVAIGLAQDVSEACGSAEDCLSPNREVDIFRFTDAEGDLVAMCAADPETAEVVQFRGARREVRVSATVGGDCGDPTRTVVMTESAAPEGFGRTTCVMASTVRVRVNEDGTITVTVDGEDIGVAGDGVVYGEPEGGEAPVPEDDGEPEQASL